MNAFRAEPIDDLGFAKIDTHRAMRQGFPEVIFGSGKTPEQVATIAVRILKHEQRVLITRVDDDQAIAVAAKLPAAVYHESARCITIETKQQSKRSGSIAVLCAGTSDLPVADEAAVTAGWEAYFEVLAQGGTLEEASAAAYKACGSACDNY